MKEKKHGECSSCGWNGQVTHRPDPGYGQYHAADLCDVCQETIIGQYLATQPGLHIDHEHVLRAIGYATNMIMAAVKKDKQQQ